MRQLAEIGVTNVGELRALGSVTAYASLKLRFPRTSLNALYAIEAGLRGVHWQRVTPDEKTILRKAAIKAIASARQRGF
ncbi:MAG: competence protein TfoX [Rhodobiaceae bacterium]|nr:MAG: competence protein TfoX [Rhodobiaceae bacterium]